MKNSLVEPSVAADATEAGNSFQFQRSGYFAVDPDSKPGALVFNRACTLKESVLTKSIKGK
jgi:glutaminyl-tRNA synthetase